MEGISVMFIRMIWEASTIDGVTSRPMKECKEVILNTGLRIKQRTTVV